MQPCSFHITVRQLQHYGGLLAAWRLFRGRVYVSAGMDRRIMYNACSCARPERLGAASNQLVELVWYSSRRSRCRGAVAHVVIRHAVGEGRCLCLMRREFISFFAQWLWTQHLGERKPDSPCNFSVTCIPAEVAVTAEAHNPQLVRAPDGSFLLMDSCGWSLGVLSVLRDKDRPSALHGCRRGPRGGLPQHMQLLDMPAGPNVRRQRPRCWALYIPRVEQYSR